VGNAEYFYHICKKYRKLKYYDKIILYMLDIKLFRENPEIIKDSLERRNEKNKIKLVDEIIKWDKEIRDLKRQADKLKHSRNEISKEIALLKKAGKDAKKTLAKAKSIPKEIEKKDKEIKSLQDKIMESLFKIPNLLDKRVPLGNSDKDDKVVRFSGKPKAVDFELKSHGEMAELLGGADFKRASKVSGTGFYYMLGDLALLNQALIRFGVDLLIKRGFLYVEPPLMIRKKPYSGVVDLNDFENVMYKIEGDDLYLIATAEHPLVSRFMDEVILEKDLPMKFVGYSMSFRREIGSHGVDTRGFFRTHQFNKVEQVIFCEPKDSWKFFEELQKNSEDLFKELGIPFRVVEICSGELGMIATRKYDIEAWMPRQGGYREVTSCSNCLDYQARILNIRYFFKKGNKVVPHTLNNTGIATSRALVAILENYQKKDGSLEIPKVLQKYMGKKILKPK
jgi:seryl-tRNA synthetase